MCDEDVERVMRHPRGMVGTDGLYRVGDRSHPRAFSSFPRFLGRYVRDKGILSMEEGIRKITGQPAAVYNLQSKGLIRVGMDADLTLFDPAAIIDNSDFVNFNAKNSGIKAVYQGGRLVVADNVWNGKLFGKVLR
jgi:N-acyl-D-amino-acid deacylase